MVVSSTTDTSCLDAKASQTMKIMRMTAVKGMNEPVDDMVFHVVYLSG